VTLQSEDKTFGNEMEFRRKNQLDYKTLKATYCKFPQENGTGKRNQRDSNL
jgi:hypothetical protein